MSATKETKEVKPLEPAAGVPEKQKFVFSDYSDNTESFDPSDISAYVKEGVDMSPYHTTWIRFTHHEKAMRRYFRRVKADEHGDLFKADAFDPIHGLIGRGHEYMAHTMNGIPEVALYIRPVEANEAEARQLNEASQKRLDPANNEALRKVQERIGSVVGAEHAGAGISTTRTRPSNWEV